MSDYRIETKCIQSGYEPDNGEPRVLPIYQSTTFRYTSSEQMGRLFDLEESGYFYTRLQNPTNDAVAAKICDLEGGVAAMMLTAQHISRMTHEKCMYRVKAGWLTMSGNISSTFLISAAWKRTLTSGPMTVRRMTSSFSHPPTPSGASG